MLDNIYQINICMLQVILNKYTNTACLNRLSAECSTKSVAISINVLKPTGYRMHQPVEHFNNCTFCPYHICVFCICLRTNSDLCRLHKKLIGFYNLDDKCLECGTVWAFKWSGLCSIFWRLIWSSSNFFRWFSEKHKIWGRSGDMELNNLSGFPLRPQIFWWNIVIEILRIVWLPFTIKKLSLFVVGGFFWMS
jgi:hypothetical protein